MTTWLAARNLLAVRLDNLGDVVMIGPALRAVKQALPQAQITLLGSPGGVAAATLLPWIDEVIAWRPIWQDIHGRAFDPADDRRLIKQIAERAFDAALIFTSFSQTPHVPAYLCYLAGIPLRAGESKEFGGGVLTDALTGTPEQAHQVERDLRLVEHLGFPVEDRQLAISIPPAARATARLLASAKLDSDRPFVLLHLGASARARRYPAARFGEAARLLAERGWQVLVTGVEREAELVQTVLARCPSARSILSADLLTYAALIERAALVICNNTLPLHLADAVRTPLLVLYSGTDYEEQWRPRASRAILLRRPTPCHPCYLFDCPIGQPCLDVPPDELAVAAEQLLTSTEVAVGGVS